MAPAMTRRRKAHQDLKAEAAVDTTSSEDAKQQHKLPVRAKEDDVAKAPVQGTMKVFGDDDDLDVPAPVLSKPAAPVEEEEEEEEEESDDDEAPEAVSTTKAASDAIKSTQAAQKAAAKVAQEKATAQKRKRQQRDALFKQQASERKKPEAKSTDEPSSEDEEVTPAKSLIQSRKAPNLLPAEFLTDSSSEDEDAGEDEDAAAVSRPRKRRIGAVERSLARQARGPRDETVGSTVYRVASKVDERMAPKSRKHAKSSKELLLKRNRNVTKQRSGFFVK